MHPIFKRGHTADWTLERIARLTLQEIKRLRENAERLNESAVVALCDEALKGRRTRAARNTAESGSGER